ncbi:NAD-dependent epimerase/dehydratase family protein [Rhodococcus spelaei]|uniref:NAD-dependent epimerase/dehydratase family protein n=1 Tax=Rhodococcus spelaei TaxID=2546320 RepID=A0A541BQS9_9NOCA|nr:NAD-dependent epimerase/dehydratase family protein [Rhodococcus spelaei]TQF74673.1 NAD-dependent epimerase/dehydratase family protein [Rhodococcus spelaei]
MSTVQVVTGAGPVGWTVAVQLAEQGHQVRVLTRSGSGPDHPNVHRVQVDVSKPGALDAALDGASAVYHCTHGSVYSAAAWRRELPATERAVLAAAGRAGAVVVFPESLYSYGPVDGPITEDTPRTATTGKLGVRTELLRQREDSATPTVSVAASDFFGPHALTAHAGERMVPVVLAGKTVRVLAALDVPHSFTYVPDLAAAMIAAAEDPTRWNSVLHAPTGPAVTQRQMVQAFADAAGTGDPKVGVLPAWAVRAIGAVHGPTRELAEMLYQFERPFVLDSTRSEQLLGLAPTPLPEAAAATVAWWRARDAAPAPR